MIDSQKYSIILPGRVVKYYPENQTADVQICAESISSDSETLGKVIVRAPLEGVPVHTPSGGGWSMTMPIKEGNTCILFFSQVGYDHWLYEDKDKAGLLANMPKPWLRRKFQEDDGFALVGLNTIPTAVKDYAPNDSEWRNEDRQQVITLKEGLSIQVDSPVSVTINAPSVVVNCDTSEVNASASASINTAEAIIDASASASITTAVATIDASASASISTPSFTVDSPLSTFTGLVACSGIGAGMPPAAGKMSVAGSIDATGDVVAGGTSVQGHNHYDSLGDPTSSPL